MPPNTKKGEPGSTTSQTRPDTNVAISANNSTPKVTPLAFGRLSPRRGGWSLIVDECPFCGQQHRHGAPNGPATRETTRISHCAHGQVRSYRIVVEEVA
ncbi:hypothetical protein Ppa06_26390 [Planomonospora parontospora subsp. parontospora]|uniref:Uncharacterized protein n=2 Tax=Planomonospora parontospora TaxID=58119 RepID=A0AA37BES6_9ACTN|nr:hypothetical protein [Planomonospora parontospora]GGK59891.1 hypothetical protein GCM10010126_19290 [Planomonospora parontospora]GII08841.1 hypothetical protein Ppa06_26390 [Planomonospora parontospora subsp. parontospora]